MTFRLPFTSEPLNSLLLRRHLGLHPGTPGQAVVLALLFGSLHWFPLLEERRRKQPVKA